MTRGRTGFKGAETGLAEACRVGESPPGSFTATEEISSGRAFRTGVCRFTCSFSELSLSMRREGAADGCIGAEEEDIAIALSSRTSLNGAPGGMVACKEAGPGGGTLGVA